MKSIAPSRAAALAVSSLLALSSVPAFALFEVAGGVVKVNTVGSVSYDTNVRGQENGEGDTIFTVTPTATFNRAEGRIVWELHAMTSKAAYSDDDQATHTDYSIGGSANIPFSEGSPFSGGVNFSASKMSAVQELVNDLVSTKQLSFGGSLAYQFSERLALTSSLSWSKSDNAGIGENKTLSGSLGAQFPQLLFRRLPLTVSYDYSKMESDEAGPTQRLNNKSNGFSLSTSGKMTEKTTGSISVGWSKTKSTGTEATDADQSSINVSTNLGWQVDELLSTTLTISRGLTASPDNSTILNTSVAVSATRQLSQTLTTTWRVSQSWNDYQSTARSVKTFNASGSLAYSFSKYWSASLNASHSKNESDGGGQDFDRNVFTLSFSLTL